MPIYEYVCKKCGKKNEFLEKLSDQPIKKCPDCGSDDLQKLFSTFSPQVKAGESKRCHGCTDFKCPHSTAH